MKILKKILLVLLVLLYIPLASEFVLRTVAFVPMLPRYVCSMPYGIRGNEPNKSYWHQTSEYKVHIETNAQGMRSPYDIPYEKKPGTKRVLLLGDSFGMGYGVSYEEMFTSRLKSYLEVEGYNVEIINLSSSGHGNAEELIVLQEEGIKYDPELVILGWHRTDLDDNIRSNLYKIEDGILTRAAETYLPAMKTREKLFKYPVYRFLAENSNLYNFFRDWAGRNVKLLLLKLKSSKPTKKEVNETDLNDNYKTDLAISLLEKVKTVCTNNNSKFMILDIPVKTSRVSFKSVFPKEQAQNHSFNIVSPIEKFKEAQGQKVYWEKSHGHFTPLGCDFIGKELAEYIIKNNLLNDK